MSSLEINVLIPDIINEIKRENIRVLVWNNEKSWWNILVDEEYYRICIYNSAYHILNKSTKAAKANKRKSTANSNIFNNLDGYNNNTNTNTNTNVNESCFDLPWCNDNKNDVFHPTRS